MTGPFRPGPPPGGVRPGPPPGVRPGPRPGPPPAGSDDEVGEARHPAVDAAVQAMINAEGLPPADQIAQYEAAYQTLRETLATIDQT
ncbi:hypothetical protein [Micromonospora coxensis]|uniref:Uncharacterized protein n=1 Tax=Micromonospora coxensis TaxID=356852 RepID=A0A1C5JV50_9ACTN|nr:hypothetical protein [Micromonospora coxensis]SCG74357.1 hypothetical protein GA0070614_5428 [Micromonospora coxensis]